MKLERFQHFIGPIQMARSAPEMSPVDVAKDYARLEEIGHTIAWMADTTVSWDHSPGEERASWELIDEACKIASRYGGNVRTGNTVGNVLRVRVGECSIDFGKLVLRATA